MSVNTMIELHKKLTHMLQQLEAEGLVNRGEPTATNAGGEFSRSLSKALRPGTGSS
jgi:hypothetical protein